MCNTMTQLPSGTVTFLFTDIAGSTRQWERYGSAMHAAVAWHDALMRQAIQQRQGYIFKALGDAFCVAFPTAADAVEAALAAQVALATQQDASGEQGRRPVIKVRMSLHTGSAELREGDYFGAALSRVARILGVAHGGQVLLSQSTYDLVCDQLPTQTSLADLRLHRLRDLNRPERIFQLQHPLLPSEFPALLSLDSLPTNLPQQLTSFIGREEQIAEVRKLVAGTRLLTLTGSGGCGKTRLALQVAADIVEEFPDGVWLVELAGITDPELTLQTVATALQIQEGAGQPLTATLTEYLKTRKLLLLLDNCEHLLDATAHFSETVLRACKDLTIITTAREPLGVPGETAWRVPSLSLPTLRRSSSATEITPSSLVHSEAVRLFVDRACSVLPQFTLNGTNAFSIYEICRRLDGIPLAIELAAALVNVLSPEQIHARLNNFFRLLTRGSRTALARQQTLLAAIKWSYDLLDDQERTLLRRLSVFQGGWTLEAAGAVCGDDNLEEWEVLDALSRLVNKSLVLREEGLSGAPRYRFLESVRQFSQERLSESGEVETLPDRHRDYFLGVAERAQTHFLKPEQKSWFELLETEHENLRAALTWSVEPVKCMRLASAIHRFWLIRGYLREGRSWLEGSLARDRTAAPALRAKTLNAAGVLCWAQGDPLQAQQYFLESLELHRNLNNEDAVAGSFNNLGLVARYQGDYASARQWHSESLSIYRSLKKDAGIAVALSNTGNVAFQQEEYEAAEVMFKESLELYRRLEDRSSIAVALHNLGEVYFRTGSYAEAYSHFIEALSVGLEIGHKSIIASSLLSIGLMTTEQSRYNDAVWLLAASDGLHLAIGSTMETSVKERYGSSLDRLRSKMSEAQFNELWTAGKMMSVEQAVVRASGLTSIDKGAAAC
jgi:predicted ATPase/class 3 adenylate cyclase/Tfp pilus assembly protein PilF